MKVLKIIQGRYSVREFKNEEVSGRIIKNSLEAARWAPSGLNNQPWRFMVLKKKKKDTLAEYTKYSRVIKKANILILVFLDKNSSYNYQKDLMAIGAAVQNILLYLYSEGAGGCWLGEIVNKAKEIEKKLKVPPQLEFVAALAIGIPKKKIRAKGRKPLKNLILTE